MEQEFRIRTYGFGELAQLYFPTISSKSASWQLTKWINESGRLKEVLEKQGKKSKQRILSPAQVKLIIEVFGAP